MVPLLGIDDLAAGWGVADLADDGSPTCALLMVDLDAAASADDEKLRSAAAAARASLAIVVGVATRPVPPRLHGLADALALTLSPPDATGARTEVVPVGDVDAASRVLAAAVGAAPRASIAVVQVMRQTEHLDVRSGLAAEAAAYSMLLAGREFAVWLQRRGQARPPAAPSRPPVDVERRGDMLFVVLDRPERRNAVDAQMRDALVDALTIAIGAPELRVELSGRGPNFSSGGDLDEFGTAREVDAAYLLRLSRHPGWLLHLLGRRALVKVHGACVGAGIEMPSLSHRVEAEPDAVFSLPEVGMGVIPGAGGTVGVTRRIGRWRAAWMALSAARIDASTARAWGLVDHLCDP